ncbi:GPW/gp25 family protein [Pelistega sp. MC2]|uniref:GPW/gp25 family protein n=1 Tax=Pelistega sp. MC2 TaxID=1720297 RepID=UPI0008D9F007|nr:GPW/gp25 family protein [Pelistega sp. MC2]
MSLGMDANTGTWLSDIDHLQQSIKKILTTPIGTRVERREFGSLVPDLVDRPVNQEYPLLVYAAIATALMHHEPRLKLERMQLDLSTGTRPQIEVSGAVVMDDFDQQVDISVGL